MIANATYQPILWGISYLASQPDSLKPLYRARINENPYSCLRLLYVLTSASSITVKVYYSVACSTRISGIAAQYVYKPFGIDNIMP